MVSGDRRRNPNPLRGSQIVIGFGSYIFQWFYKKPVAFFQPNPICKKKPSHSLGQILFDGENPSEFPSQSRFAVKTRHKFLPKFDLPGQV